MPKSQKLFEDDNDADEDINFQPQSSEYSKKYDERRRKEEYLKLKNKYGDVRDSDESSSSSDDDDGELFTTEQFEKEFYRTLSCLKSKDPRIYDSNIKFFSSDFNTENVQSKNNKSNEKPMKIRDYNRKIITEKEGKFSDDEDEDNIEDIERSVSPTYVEEQKQIKLALAKVANENENSDEDENIAGMFSKRKLTKEEEEAEEKSYREWLAGEIKHLQDNSDENDLKPLKDYWNNPTLEEDEAFLRDYLLNQRFRDPTKKKSNPTYENIVNEPDEDISEDERLFEEQQQFEEHFNYRFEEPDQEFIKRYPRTLEFSMRKKENKRAQKRTEVKERKLEEKKKKQEEINRMKSLKLKEIQDKILKLKEITGNDQLAFDDEDIEGDFDPDAYDRKMKEIFNDDYYGQEVDSSKPDCPELDDELDIDDWDRWNGQNSKSNNHRNNEPHCEDEDFNMDCDYNPSTSKNKSLIAELQENTEGKRKRRKRKNQLAEALAKKKPLFDPSKNASFSQYLDEYYKLDCEDIIGDLPCRFKYRQVPPADYGLTTAEILMADDKELNQWYPLKKALQYRPDHKDINDQRMFSSKGRNIELKKKILPSLFSNPTSDDVDDSNVQQEESNVNKKKKKRKNKKKKMAETNDDKQEELEPNLEESKNVIEEVDNANEIEENNDLGNVNKKKKKKNKQLKQNSEEIKEVVNDIDNLEKSNKKNKKKRKNLDGSTEISENPTSEPSDEKPQKKKRKLEQNEDAPSSSNNKISRNQNHDLKNKSKKNKNKFSKKEDKPSDPISNISDERLKAYGLNPKKYKSFLKYKNY